jgi:esterase
VALWGDAVQELARLGRVISYDRRGCGRSYGGTVAATLALRHPDRVRALVLLEPDASRELAPATARWVDGLGELAGEWWLPADAAALAGVTQPALLVGAADSPRELREPAEALAAALPNARTGLVEGGHLIHPAHPEVLDFIADELS